MNGSVDVERLAIYGNYYRFGVKGADNVMRNRLVDLCAKLGDFQIELRTLDTLLEIDTPSSLNKIRFIAEKVLHRLCTRNEVSWGNAEPTLERMVGPLVAGEYIPKNVAIHVRTIQGNASPGSHYQESALEPGHLNIAMAALVEFLRWYEKASAAGEVRPNSG
jgi:hypothetical protein